MYEKALALDPQYAEAYAWLGATYYLEWIWRWSADPQTLERALALEQQAVALDDSLPIAHSALGIVYMLQQQYDQAMAEGERAIALEPNLVRGYAVLADVLSRVGRPEEAVAMAEQALRRKPTIADVHLGDVGAAYYLAGRPEEAIAPLKRYLARYPNFLGAHLTLAAVYSELGKEAEAQAEVAKVLRLNPKFSLEVHRQRVPLKDPAMLERHLAALRKAGLK